tara:strand:+ start:472 stop:678 length:207 start_codon:yes stop_codon:yes gene_type:complete
MGCVCGVWTALEEKVIHLVYMANWEKKKRHRIVVWQFNQWVEGKALVLLRSVREKIKPTLVRGKGGGK